MKFFDRYPGKGQMGSEKLNADFFLLIYEIQWKKQPQKEETIIHSLILLLAQKLSQNFEITLHLPWNIFKYLYGSHFSWRWGKYFFSVPRLEPFETGVGDSVQFSCSVTSDSLWPHGLQHTRPPCPSPTPGVYPNACPSSWWCHPTISSSVIPFASCLQSFPASGSFPISLFFTSGGRSLEFQLQHQSFQWTFRTVFL